MKAPSWQQEGQPSHEPYDGFKPISSQEGLKTELESAKASTLPIFVLFMTDWCPKCQAIEPHLNQLALTSSSKAKFVLVNIDTNIETASEYGVDDASQLPKLLCFKGDYKTSESIDGIDQSKYISFVEDII